MRKESEKKISNSLWFVIIMFIVYGVIAIFNFSLIQTASIKTIEIFIKLIPILLFVFIINLLVEEYLNSNKIKKYFGESSGLLGWFYASIAGILIAGPPYVLYPLLGDFKKKGMSNSLLAVFLYNRNVKIPFIPVMIYYFGFAFTVIVSIYIIIFSILNGLIIKKLVKES